ncbi:MAG: nucleotidyltransferase family protein [Salinibacter sp.]
MAQEESLQWEQGMQMCYTTWIRRFAEQERARQSRLRRARQAAQACARQLYHTYGVCDVYLLGSVADAVGFHERSDLDLAVRGLPDDRYFHALASLRRQLPAGLGLDLIPLEDAQPEIRQKVLQEGVRLQTTAQVESTDGRHVGPTDSN